MHIVPQLACTKTTMNKFTHGGRMAWRLASATPPRLVRKALESLTADAELLRPISPPTAVALPSPPVPPFEDL